MPDIEPLTTLSTAFSGDHAVATEWAVGRDILRDAEVYWLSTVRPDGRPHVTSLLGVWLDGAMVFCTGSTERKARNLAQNPHCILTTGCNVLDGLDVVMEGKVSKVSAADQLRRIAAAYEAKYGERFTAPGGTWFGLGDAIRRAETPVYRLKPSTAFGFGKGTTFSQTHWKFS